MQVKLELFELRKLLIDAAELGAKEALIKAGLDKPTISQSRAFALHGRKVVERWVREGLVTPFKDGENNSKVRYDSLELEVLAKLSNRLSYFSNLEKSY